LVEPVQGGFERGQQAFPHGLVDHFMDYFRAGLGFAQQALLGEFNNHSLCAGGDQ
jgi:hypothetical protein